MPELFYRTGYTPQELMQLSDDESSKLLKEGERRLKLLKTAAYAKMHSYMVPKKNFTYRDSVYPDTPDFRRFVTFFWSGKKDENDPESYPSEQDDKNFEQRIVKPFRFSLHASCALWSWVVETLTVNPEIRDENAEGEVLQSILWDLRRFSDLLLMVEAFRKIGMQMALSKFRGLPVKLSEVDFMLRYVVI